MGPCLCRCTLQAPHASAFSELLFPKCVSLQSAHILGCKIALSMAFISTVVSIGITIVALSYLRAYLARREIARQNGCRLLPKRRNYDPVFGLTYKKQDSASTKQFKSLPRGAARHQEYGQTYEESSLFDTTIKTSSPDNIQAVFGSKAQEFGVEPFRLVGMQPFCGDGLLTRDGHIWERSRSMIRPSFHKNNISDLTTFASAVDRLLPRIPGDGSTIDLQPLISLMVRHSVRY